MTHRPSLAEPAFPGDDGTVYPALAAAFGDDVQVVSVLGGVRVFVPVLALLGESPTAPGAGPGTPTENGSDKNADMAAVLLTGADGRRGLLAFSSVAAMQAWDPAARPVPVWGQQAARAALDEGATAILLDLANPTFTVVETDDVEHVAAGHRLVRTDLGSAWVVDPA